MKELIEAIIKGIVKHPESVELHYKETEDAEGAMTVVHVQVSKDDVGVCIGSGGATAEALRRITGLIGYRKTNTRLFLKIDAPKLPENHFGYTG